MLTMDAAIDCTLVANLGLLVLANIADCDVQLVLVAGASCYHGPHRLLCQLGEVVRSRIIAFDPEMHIDADIEENCFPHGVPRRHRYLRGQNAPRESAYWVR